ncbi:MAG: hypothetical protein H6747_15175 [Deltaproteobacteria bacterium]|nr:hypothetical protein [Deltaproteobacteria bacterium]
MKRERTIIVTTVEDAEERRWTELRAMTGDERMMLGESLRQLYDPFGKRGSDGGVPRLQRVLRVVERA